MGSLDKIANDFKRYGIFNFTPREIERTGASLKSVRIETMVVLQEVRSQMAMPFILIHNGLTTGNHVAPEHADGRAVDFTIPSIRPEDFRRLVVYAVRAGFCGIGLYWNSVAYSFHLDLRPIERFAIWGTAKRMPGSPGWDVSKTIVGKSANLFDPRVLI
jgi:hypothetical protein